MSTISYFLGGNTARGFYSCYDQFCRPEDGAFLWIIKGGPGCGKSTLMRRVGTAAEKKGYDVEYVLCSGDPDSLDGVYLPQLKVGIADGTAPHILEPTAPGVCSGYLDLGRFYDRERLSPLREEFLYLTHAYQKRYAAVYALLADFKEPGGGHPIASSESRKRFASAITCKGIITLPAVSQPSDSTIEYLHPLWPEYVQQRISAGNNTLEELFDTLPDCSRAVFLLKEAKTLHDALESLYRPYVDFAAVTEQTERLISEIL